MGQYRREQIMVSGVHRWLGNKAHGHGRLVPSHQWGSRIQQSPIGHHSFFIMWSTIPVSFQFFVKHTSSVFMNVRNLFGEDSYFSITASIPLEHSQQWINAEFGFYGTDGVIRQHLCREGKGDYSWGLSAYLSVSRTYLTLVARLDFPVVFPLRSMLHLIVLWLLLSSQIQDTFRIRLKMANQKEGR